MNFRRLMTFLNEIGEINSTNLQQKAIAVAGTCGLAGEADNHLYLTIQ